MSIAHRNLDFQNLLKMCYSAGLKFSHSNISLRQEITGHFGQGISPISHSQFPSLIAACLVSMGLLESVILDVMSPILINEKTEKEQI